MPCRLESGLGRLFPDGGGRRSAYSYLGNGSLLLFPDRLRLLILFLRGSGRAGYRFFRNGIQERLLFGLDGDAELRGDFCDYRGFIHAGAQHDILLARDLAELYDGQGLQFGQGHDK